MARKRIGGGNEERRIAIDDARVVTLFHGGHTAAEIAALFGCSTHPVKKAMQKLGLRRPAKQRPGAMAGERNPAWKGGRRIRADRYVELWTPNGPELEHRVVMARVLGRPLLSDELVHHRDRNRQNNDPANLELTNHSDHAREHVAEMHAARYGR